VDRLSLCHNDLVLNETADFLESNILAMGTFGDNITSTRDATTGTSSTTGNAIISTNNKAGTTSQANSSNNNIVLNHLWR
jgi:hypothetical protein